MGVSLHVNVPVQLGIVELNDTITVSNIITPPHIFDSFRQESIFDYEAFKSGIAIANIGNIMTRFTTDDISINVSQGLVIKAGSKLTSIKIQIADNANTTLINDALSWALSNLPSEQPDVIQLVFTFVLSNAAIDTADYSYNGKMSWTLGINYTLEQTGFATFATK